MLLLSKSRLGYICTLLGTIRFVCLVFADGWCAGSTSHTLVTLDWLVVSCVQLTWDTTESNLDHVKEFCSKISFPQCLYLKSRKIILLSKISTIDCFEKKSVCSPFPSYLFSTFSREFLLVIRNRWQKTIVFFSICLFYNEAKTSLVQRNKAHLRCEKGFRFQ